MARSRVVSHKVVHAAGSIGDHVQLFPDHAQPADIAELERALLPQRPHHNGCARLMDLRFA